MKFEVGMRVAVYCAELGRITGTVRPYAGEIGPTITITVDHKNGWPMFATVHHKQCRRLVRKPKRRIWIDEFSPSWDKATKQANVHTNGHAQFLVFTEDPQHSAMIEFVEVKRKKGKE